MMKPKIDADINAERQVIGCLLNKPSLFSEIGESYFEQKDFTTNLNRHLFVLAYNRISSAFVTLEDIQSYFHSVDGLKDRADNTNDLNLIVMMLESADEIKFKENSLVVKKISVLKQLEKMGIDLTPLFEGINPTDELNKKLDYDKMGLVDIFNFFEGRVAGLKAKILTNSGAEGVVVSHNLKQLKENLKEHPDVGQPLMGNMFNTICRGARLGRLLMVSGSSSSGKSRTSFANACYMSIPEYYNTKTKKWITRPGYPERSLIISTEMQIDECQSIILAHISGVNEEHIIMGTYEDDEEKIVDEAIEILEKYKDNLFIVEVAEPNIAVISSLIKRYATIEQVKYVFYDYIFSNNSLMQEHSRNTRQDSALLMFATQLKALAQEFNIFIYTGSQLNASYMETTGIRDERCLADAKSLKFKIDLGFILCRITDEEEQLLQEVGFDFPNGLMPTHVCDCYKNRRGGYTNIRIWQHIDLGTARTTDLFVTDGKMKLVNMIELYVQ